MNTAQIAPAAWMKSCPADLESWLEASSGRGALYAIVSGVAEASPLSQYVELEPNPKSHRLYTTDPYRMWLDHMPKLVEISDASPFIEWCKGTQSKDWGWVFRSDASSEQLVAYFSGLTQVITQQDKPVFFRYWDGHFLNIINQSIAEETALLWPVVNDYWVNGIQYVTKVAQVIPPQASPWWRLPKGLMEDIEQADPEPVVTNLAKWVKEEKAHLYFAYPEPVVKAKVRYFYHQWMAKQSRVTLTKRGLFPALCQYLQQELQL